MKSSAPIADCQLPSFQLVQSDSQVLPFLCPSCDVLTPKELDSDHCSVSLLGPSKVGIVFGGFPPLYIDQLLRGTQAGPALPGGREAELLNFSTSTRVTCSKPGSKMVDPEPCKEFKTSIWLRPLERINIFPFVIDSTLKPTGENIL